MDRRWCSGPKPSRQALGPGFDSYTCSYCQNLSFIYNSESQREHQQANEDPGTSPSYYSYYYYLVNTIMQTTFVL